MIKPYLIATQNLDIKAVNEAYIDVLIEEEDHVTLRDATENHKNFDSLKYAARLEKHALLEFRRLAASLYAAQGKWDESLALSQADRIVKDALITAATSKDPEVVEKLATYYLDIGAKEAFTALLYVAYDYISLDKVEELSWRFALGDFVRPFQITSQHLASRKIAALEKELAELKTKAVAKEQKEEEETSLGPGFGGRLMIGGPANGGGMGVSPAMTGLNPAMTGMGGGFY